MEIESGLGKEFGQNMPSEDLFKTQLDNLIKLFNLF